MKTVNTKSAANGNGNVRLPTASDLKPLPKRLSADRRKAIETTKAVLEGLGKYREGELPVDK